MHLKHLSQKNLDHIQTVYKGHNIHEDLQSVSLQELRDYVSQRGLEGDISDAEIEYKTTSPNTNTERNEETETISDCQKAIAWAAIDSALMLLALGTVLATLSPIAKDRILSNVLKKFPKEYEDYIRNYLNTPSSDSVQNAKRLVKVAYYTYNSGVLHDILGIVTNEMSRLQKALYLVCLVGVIAETLATDGLGLIGDLVAALTSFGFVVDDLNNVAHTCWKGRRKRGKRRNSNQIINNGDVVTLQSYGGVNSRLSGFGTEWLYFLGSQRYQRINGERFTKLYAHSSYSLRWDPPAKQELRRFKITTQSSDVIKGRKPAKLQFINTRNEIFTDENLIKLDMSTLKFSNNDDNNFDVKFLFPERMGSSGTIYDGDLIYITPRGTTGKYLCWHRDRRDIGFTHIGEIPQVWIIKKYSR